MNMEENKAVFRRFLQALNEGSVDTMRELADPQIVDHGFGWEAPRGFEGVKQQYLQFRAEYPDLHYSLEDLLAEGDKVVCRWTLRGTHHASGERLTLTGINIDRIANGRIVEHWANHNRLMP